MKRILPLATTLVVLTFNSLAQNCVADTSIKEPGIYPESLDTAFVSSTYNATIHVLAIKDTVVMFSGQQINATIDSIRLDTIEGLPAGFTYNCNPSNCLYTYDSVGCVSLTGPATSNIRGVYPLKIKTTAYARWGLLKLPVQDSITDYQLVIYDSTKASVEPLLNTSISVYPNPSENKFYHITSKTEFSVLRVTTIEGKDINTTITRIADGYKLDLIDAPQGIYHIHIKQEDKYHVRKIFN